MDPTPTPDPSERPVSEGPSPRAWIWLVALVPCAVAVLQLGRLHPDEVYQSLEPAYWRVHGYGILSWEWQSGLRNWFLPGVLAGFLWLAKAVGLADPRLYRAVVELPVLLLHAWAVWAAYRYLARRSQTRGGAVPALLAFGLYGPVVAFAGRTLSESISAAFLIIAVEALDRATLSARWEGLVGGFALGMAVVTRYPSAVIVLAALAWLVLRRRWKTLYYATFAGAAVAGVLGLLDWATWGAPFHTLRQYLEFNVFSDLAARQFGTHPWSWYFPWLVQLPAWVLIAFPFAVSKPGNRLGLPLFASLVYFVVITLTPHKELRFLYPVLVLLTLFGAGGLSRAYELLRHRWLKKIAFAVTLLAGFLPFFFQGEVRGDQFHAIVKATRPDDTRGLLIMGEGIWGAGGYFYIGKQIPWMVADWPRDGSYQAATGRPKVFNKIVTYDRRAESELEAKGYEVVERIGRATIMSYAPKPPPTQTRP